MTIRFSKPILLATAIGTLALAANVAVADSKVVGYLVDQRDVVARSGTGLCWRTGYWTPAMAREECDPDLVKKPMEAKPAAPAAEAPAPAAKPVMAKVTLAADALFDYDKAVLRSEGIEKLDALVKRISDVKLEVILAVGHADRIGSDKYNQKLSERRAEAVKAFFVSKGVEPNRVYTEGKGEKQPITTKNQCSNLGKDSGKNRKLVECLQPDRRVDIEVIGTRVSN